MKRRRCSAVDHPGGTRTQTPCRAWHSATRALDWGSRVKFNLRASALTVGAWRHCRARNPITLARCGRALACCRSDPALRRPRTRRTGAPLRRAGSAVVVRAARARRRRARRGRARLRCNRDRRRCNPYTFVSLGARRRLPRRGGPPAVRGRDRCRGLPPRVPRPGAGDRHGPAPARRWPRTRGIAPPRRARPCSRAPSRSTIIGAAATSTAASARSSMSALAPATHASSRNATAGGAASASGKSR